MKKATASNSNLNTHLIEDKTQTTLNVDSGIFYALISLINIIGININLRMYYMFIIWRSRIT